MEAQSNTSIDKNALSIRLLFYFSFIKYIAFLDKNKILRQAHMYIDQKKKIIFCNVNGTSMSSNEI